MYEISSEKLKQVRERANMTQSEIARLIGKNAVDVSHYENDRATPPADSLITLLIELDVNPKDVANRKS
jgi:transcriptional regulator with XRE-family HTH domain